MIVLFRLQLWLTMLVLFVVYVLIITPVALISRVVGRDPLRLRKHRWGDPHATAWEPRAKTSPDSYLRQY